MYFIRLFNLWLLLGFSQAHFGKAEEIGDGEIIDFTTKLFSEEAADHQDNSNVFTRIARSVFGNISSQSIRALEKLIIGNCKANQQVEIAEKLQPSFDKMKDCIRKNKFFLTPKEEFLASLEECSRDSIEKSKSCLLEHERYFPDMLLAQARSLIKFIYNNYDSVRELGKCLPNFKKEGVLSRHKQCLRDIKGTNSDVHRIPPSKAEFCQKFVRASYCFTNMIKENCDRTPGLAKYREGYIRSHKEPCEENETIGSGGQI